MLLVFMNISLCANSCAGYPDFRSTASRGQQVTLDCRYILPSLSLVPSDHEEGVKVQFALVLAQLAAAANRFLLHLQHLANTQLQPDPSSPTLVSHTPPTYDMHSLQSERLIQIVA